MPLLLFLRMNHGWIVIKSFLNCERSISMKLRISVWSSFIFIFFLTLSMVGGDHLNLDDLLGGTRRHVVTRFLRYFVGRLRDGLADSKVANLTISNIDGSIVCSNLNGELQTRNNRVVGLSTFNMVNLSSSVTKMELQIDLEVPILEFTGMYYIQGKFAGFIPVWGGGSYAVRFPNFKVNGSGQLQGRVTGDASSQIKINEPSISVGGIELEFDGLLSRLNAATLLLILISIATVYTAIVVMVTRYLNVIRTRVKHKRLSMMSSRTSEKP